jgi:outer membrane protein OmpA-like peptidoglycan-associated protein
VQGRISAMDEYLHKIAPSAKTCAPMELAFARSRARFAKVALDEGDLSRAEREVEQAEIDGRSAELLSPPEKCQGDYEARPDDRDGDGYPDNVDKCPNDPETYNGFQDEDGCPDDPDTDGDGIADSVDVCLLAPEDKDGYLDDDGCPDVDNDGDGVADAQDQCPKEGEDPDGFQDADGCPDPDNDRDTVLDVDDFCPNSPGIGGGIRPGCPFKDAPAVLTEREIRISQQIQFETNRAVIRPGQSQRTLIAVSVIMKALPFLAIEVQGHTDNKGDPGHNKKLSQQRAEAVRAFLIAQGIAGTRLVATGFGQTQPLVPNVTEKNRALNRRVQFVRTDVRPAP